MKTLFLVIVMMQGDVVPVSVVPVSDVETCVRYEKTITRELSILKHGVGTQLYVKCEIK